MPSSMRLDRVGLVADGLLLAAAQVGWASRRISRNSSSFGRSTSRRRPCRRRGPATISATEVGWYPFSANRVGGERHQLAPRAPRPAASAGGPSGATPYGHLTERSRTGGPAAVLGTVPRRETRSFTCASVGSPAMETYVRARLAARPPGALGAVASRIGAVRGDVVGIEILERGAARPSTSSSSSCPNAGARRPAGGRDQPGRRRRRRGGPPPVAEALHDPRLDALETAAMLVGGHRAGRAARRRVRARRAGRVGRRVGGRRRLDDGEPRGRRRRRAPTAGWLSAFVTGSQRRRQVAAGDAGPDDVVWAPLPAAGLALVVGRDGIAVPGPGAATGRPPWPGSSTPGSASSKRQPRPSHQPSPA